VRLKQLAPGLSQGLSTWQGLSTELRLLGKRPCQTAQRCPAAWAVAGSCYGRRIKHSASTVLYCSAGRTAAAVGSSRTLRFSNWLMDLRWECEIQAMLCEVHTLCRCLPCSCDPCRCCDVIWLLLPGHRPGCLTGLEAAGHTGWAACSPWCEAVWHLQRPGQLWLVSATYCVLVMHAMHAARHATH
jgi:hypothetical protein